MPTVSGTVPGSGAIVIHREKNKAGWKLGRGTGKQLGGGGCF